MLEDVSAATFAPHIGKPFQMTLADEELHRGEVLLAQVKERNLDPRLEQFSVVFQGPKSWFAPQGIYTLETPDMGSVTMLLVPIIGPDFDHHYYEAVFSRLRSTAGPGKSLW